MVVWTSYKLQREDISSRHIGFTYLTILQSTLWYNFFFTIFGLPLPFFTLGQFFVHHICFSVLVFIYLFKYFLWSFFLVESICTRGKDLWYNMDLGMMYSLKLVIFLTFFVLMNFVNLYLNVDMKQMKKPKKKRY